MRIVAALGCLVIYSRWPLKIGEVIREHGSPGCKESMSYQPLIVTGVATEAHWIRQMQFLGGPTSFPSNFTFYFVETD